MKPTDAELIRAAFKARSFAYTPYSHFKVGAALLAKNGMVYTGCNIENAGYTPTNCAERTALFKAVSEGVTEFTDIAIVGSLDGKKNTLVTGPCGVCRQALYEFCGPRLRVLMAKSEDDYIETTLGDLLPYGFGPTNLEIEPGGDLGGPFSPRKGDYSTHVFTPEQTFCSPAAALPVVGAGLWAGAGGLRQQRFL